MMKTCAVIPAAGLGQRLQRKLPKILTPLTGTDTIWSHLRKKLISLVDHIHLIISPKHETLFRQVLNQDMNDNVVSISFQAEPIGMGDAIFCGFPIWSQADRIVVIWGDQVFVSQDTIMNALAIHAGHAKTIALPLMQLSHPYVEYEFDAYDRLIDIKQSREGEICALRGYADVGTFVLSVPDLLSAWNVYLNHHSLGAKTNEINFLPFLPFLSRKGWVIRRVNVLDTIETRGINTPDDLAFFQTFSHSQKKIDEK